MTLYPILTHPTLHPAFNNVRIKLLLSLIFAVIAGVTSVLGFWALINLIADKNTDWLWRMVGLWGVSGISLGMVSYLSHRAEATFSENLRQLVIEKLVRLPASQLASHDNTQLKQLMTADIGNLHHLIAHLPTELVNFLVVPLTSLYFLLTIVGLQALWVLLPALIASLYHLVIIPKVAMQNNAVRMQAMGDIMTAVEDYTRGIRINRVFHGWNGQSQALQQYHTATQSFSHNMLLWVTQVATLGGIAVALLQAIATFAIGYVVGYRFDAVTLGATLFFSLALVTPALRLGHGLDYIGLAKASGKNLIEFLNLPSLSFGQNTLPISVNSPVSSLVIEQATLLIQGKPIIHDFSFQFLPSTVTVITAPSGTGKTTLLNVLAGFEPLTAGKVLLNQISLTSLNEQARHHALLFIPQESGVIATSVRENLKLIATHATDNQLLEALNKANLSVNLNKDATTLSGGEQQRLALAKVFLSPASIILLDEPTRALDNQTAQPLIDRLYDFAHSEQKILIIVTHDNDVVKKADVHLDLTHQTTAFSPPIIQPINSQGDV